LDPAAPSPMILLLHSSELSEVGTLLRELGMPFVERDGKLTEVDQRVDWTLVIASQERIKAFEGGSTLKSARRIAVIENDSRTLRAMLKRLGVDYVVARPVHAAALRLLVLHCLYHGPERRNQSRVSVGAKVQFRSGFFRRDAILADLSLRGCRLVSEKPVKPGTKIRVIFSADIAWGKQFSLPGRTLRSSEISKGELGQSVAIAFYGLTASHGQHLRRVFESYVNGPAKLLGTTSDLLVSGATVRAQQDEPVESERRTGPRKGYDRRVVTLNDEATRVLLCRDICLGGMRVEANDTLVPGDDLLVAIHAKARSEPLVVNARVTRDDGSGGLVLEFHDLSNESEVYLRNMVAHLPVDGGNTDDESDLIVSEIVERRAS